LPGSDTPPIGATPLWADFVAKVIWKQPPNLISVALMQAAKLAAQPPPENLGACVA
jgi:hypothetical protein